jgi:hypothetical protein
MSIVSSLFPTDTLVTPLLNPTAFGCVPNHLKTLSMSLGGCDVSKLAGVSGSGDVTGYRVCDRRCHAYLGLSRRCAVCSMELGLFVRNFQASSNGSSAIARWQFLNALSVLRIMRRFDDFNARPMTVPLRAISWTA